MSKVTKKGKQSRRKVFNFQRREPGKVTKEGETI